MELFNQGLNLMTYGIGTVFLFLCLLILAMTTMSSLLRKLPDSTDADESPIAKNTTTNAYPIDNRLLQVLQAAITEHRKP